MTRTRGLHAALAGPLGDIAGRLRGVLAMSLILHWALQWVQAWLGPALAFRCSADSWACRPSRPSGCPADLRKRGEESRWLQERQSLPQRDGQPWCPLARSHAWSLVARPESLPFG